MEPLAALWFGNQVPDIFRTTPQKAWQHRQARAGQAQLAAGHLQQAYLAAVAVKQHQTAETGCGQIESDGDHHLDDQFSRQAEAAGKADVFRGEANRLERQSGDRQLLRQGRQGPIQHPFGK